MKIANLNDLKLELWLRARENNRIVWKTKEGKVIPIKEMTDRHLINTINLLEEIEEDSQTEEEYNNYMSYLWEKL